MKYWFRTAISGALIALGLTAAASGIAADAAEPPANVTAPADDARAALAERLNSVRTYQASFTQQVFGARGQVLELSEGQVWLQRPQFKWVVKDPYPQVIVTDDDHLKIYDPDLEQLTVRDLDEALEDTPISLLTRDIVEIGDRFSVTRLPEATPPGAESAQGGGGDRAAFEIRPLTDDALYRSISLYFDTPGLVMLGILDHLGQRTEIYFSPEPATSVIESSVFQLDVPPGTDVVGG
ncbi:MAG: outer membrane lipoprotein chaperone LolA [Pseudomonadales bacterium]